MESKVPKVILIDVDGTVIFNDYPHRGADVPHAVEVLKKLQAAGHILIINTMRCDHLLDDAESWFHERDIEISYSNCNPTFETGSRKIYGHISIDDHNLGCPLKYDPELHHKKFVDWERVEEILVKEGLI